MRARANNSFPCFWSRVATCSGIGFLAAAVLFVTHPVVALDLDNDQLSDVWELIFSAQSLSSTADTDGDGFNNAQESGAGTNPFDRTSYPGLSVQLAGSNAVALAWATVAGKTYEVLHTDDLTSSWQPLDSQPGSGGTLTGTALTDGFSKSFFRLKISDVHSDVPQLSDWEKLQLGFSPTTSRTERYDQTDLQRITAGIAATASNIITVSPLDTEITERWPDPGIVAIRRGGAGLKALTVNISLSGTATPNVDYVPSATTTVSLPAGVREVWVQFPPVVDADDAEATETITLTALSGTGYTLGSTTAATINLLNETATSLPSVKAAARFLIQAAFGPDQDSPGDSDEIPENVEEVMATGFEAWIDDQFTRPVGLIQPWVNWAVVNAAGQGLHGNYKEFSWWNRVMGVAKLHPDDVATVTPDPLRQRVAFALSEIIVASDRSETLAVEQAGMANFYDLFETHAFGNYRDLLQAITLHPVMGIYLSHLGNQKANPATNVFPDENFAREIMQLFSIGLWLLNSDGTQQLNPLGDPIPTYDNGDITELARVFTGLSFGNNANFQLYPRDFTQPMKGWDAFHDCDAKTLLGGLLLPARAQSPTNAGVATMADVTTAVDNLFNHQNVGPFLAVRLIQRFVTSNPSTSYVARVAASFADNGSGVRGDMKAVIKAILLDTEARDPAMRTQPTWGKLREPILANVNLARAFNATAPAGFYALDQFALAHLQDPMNSPSVFNFFLPTHSPPGPLTQLGLVAPEFQILNASTAISAANYYRNHILGDLQYWGAGNANFAVRLNLTNELAMIVPAAQIPQDVPAGPALDPDPLLRRLNLVLTGGQLSPRQFQIIREAMVRINPPIWQWHRERLRLAIYLIVTSPEFNVLL